MWKRRLPIIIIFVLVIVAIVSIIYIIPFFDQIQLPIYVAALSILISAIGSLASLQVVFEMQKDRETLFKPEVFVNIEYESGFFCLVVRNDGRSTAHKISFQIDPIPSNLKGESIKSTTPWLNSPIPTLLPGHKFSKIIDSANGLLGNENPDVPKKFKITLSYESPSGFRYSEPPYFIDLQQFTNTKIPAQNIDESLEKIAKSLNTFTSKR